MNPLVSIIVPAYNAERYILDALRSAQAQTYEDLEIIVVDDGSTDATYRLATALAAGDRRIHVIRQANHGLSSARNAGLGAATGTYLSFLDSDDTLHPTKVSRQVDALEHTGVGIAFCDYYTTDEDLVPEAITKTRPRLSNISYLLPLRNVFPPHAALVAREVVERVGLFDESLTSAEDWDYWIRCAQVAPMVYVPGALCSYRRHGSQMHNDRSRMRQNQMRVIRKHFQRGSTQRRLATAGFHWGEAKHCYGEREFARMVLQLLRVVARTRTPTRTLQVIRIAGYG